MATENTQNPQFTNTFVGGEVEMPRQRTTSTDHSATDEWDAGKTPPSRFQKRKGSIYATPSSRDGHVERNRDAVEEFHKLTAPKTSSKRWSFSRSKKDATSTTPEAPRKASQASASSQ
ncbi:uncharacterized protein B0I36DRAFT_361019 [Microdochium trichocladiopsis]|uniref:Uncharacterized protein n=1 Tax=Microdochium trichocladiopsis TaxID=1682393 RepID=A0A9P9BTJ8_9PEZI|nr:uncharacterized protein B0I36DRAFT_361019 [Microdochium trichocladiopsis]KAH7035684.1 hypothetical protein B0I36DRAFT_361019 [Microdochium trichocladiopsis]